MMSKIQRTLFGLSLILALASGSLALYYYYTRQALDDLAFTRAFWAFVILSVFTLLVALQRPRSLPLSIELPPESPASPSSPPPTAAGTTPPGMRRVLAPPPVSPGTFGPSHLPTRGGLEGVLHDLDLPASPPPLTSSALREVRSKLRETARASPQPLAEVAEEGSVDDWLVRAMATATPTDEDLVHYWQLRYEATRKALYNLWRLYQDAEEELADLYAQRLPPPSPKAPEDSKKP